MKNKISIIAAFSCISVLAGGLADVAIAQQSRPDTTQLEEIIVTAQKRESTIETTPISLTAVSGADILNRGFTDLASLMQSVPGVSIRTSGPGMTEFEMRGVASNGGNSPTVGFYFDETPLTAPAATNEGKIVISPDLYDLNRVEVLRGPQGTLYGSGSMGGTIRVIPNAPNPDAFQSSAEVTFADTNHGGFDHAENAMVNLPFWGGLAALRIVGSYSHDAGWIDRIVIAPGEFPLATNGFTVRGNVLAAPIETDYRDVNDVEKTTVRVSAVFKPIDGLTITPSYFYERMLSGGLPYIDSNPGTDAHYQPFDIAETYRDEFHLDGVEHQVSHRCRGNQLGDRLLDAARAADSGCLGVVVDRPSAPLVRSGQRRHRCGIRGRGQPVASDDRGAACCFRGRHAPQVAGRLLLLGLRIGLGHHLSVADRRRGIRLEQSLQLLQSF